MSDRRALFGMYLEHLYGMLYGIDYTVEMPLYTVEKACHFTSFILYGILYGMRYRRDPSWYRREPRSFPEIRLSEPQLKPIFIRVFSPLSPSDLKRLESQRTKEKKQEEIEKESEIRILEPRRHQQSSTTNASKGMITFHIFSFWMYGDFCGFLMNSSWSLCYGDGFLFLIPVFRLSYLPFVDCSIIPSFVTRRPRTKHDNLNATPNLVI